MPNTTSSASAVIVRDDGAVEPLTAVHIVWHDGTVGQNYPPPRSNP